MKKSKKRVPISLEIEEKFGETRSDIWLNECGKHLGLYFVAWQIFKIQTKYAAKTCG